MRCINLNEIKNSTKYKKGKQERTSTPIKDLKGVVSDYPDDIHSTQVDQ